MSSSVPYRPCSGTLAAYAIRRESGLHRGAPAPSGASVRTTGSPPPTSTTYICGLSIFFARRKATSRPSGLIAGSVSRCPRVSRRGDPELSSGTDQRPPTYSLLCRSGRMTETIARLSSGCTVGVPHCSSRSRCSGRMSTDPSPPPSGARPWGLSPEKVRCGAPQTRHSPENVRSGCRTDQVRGTTSGAPIRAASAVSSSGICWLSRSAATRIR